MPEGLGMPSTSTPRPPAPRPRVSRIPHPTTPLSAACVADPAPDNSVAIASNESFSGWTKTFTDPRLCAAIVDRLTFGGNIVETGTTSYRLAHTLAQRGVV